MRSLVYCLFLSTAVTFSCSDEASQIGSGFFEGSSIGVTTVDTLTLKVSTIQFDSLVTSDATRLLVGYHDDGDLGVLSSTAYFQLGVGSGFSIDKSFTSFTRAELLLVHDGYSFYDTANQISFGVHRVIEPIELQDSYLFNTTTFNYSPALLGSVNYTPRPNRRDTVYIPLSEQIGRDIVRLAQAASSEVATTAGFIKYFPGLALVPTGANGPIVGFSTTVLMRVYYMDKSRTPGVERRLELTSTDVLRYNRINSDRSITALNTLDDEQESLSSAETNRKSYIQAGAGLGLRVEIPYLREMLIENEGLTILSAVLEIPPSRDNSQRNTALPTELVMNGVNYRNDEYERYSTNAKLVEDLYLGRDTHYEADISTFVKEQMKTEQYNNNAVAFVTNDATFRSTVNRLYAGDQANEREMKLTITCLTIPK